MQAAGSLKKRRRRNIGKVRKAEVDYYNPFQDHFNTHDMYGGKQRALIDPATPIGTIRGASRVTRDPKFHPSGFIRPTSFQGLDPSFTESSYDPFSARKRQASQRSEGTITGGGTKPLLLSPRAMDRLMKILLLGQTSLAFPWKWNAKERRIDNWSTPLTALWRVIWTLINMQTACLFCFQIYLFFARMTLDNGSYRPVFMNSFAVLWYFYNVMLNLNWAYNRENTRHYINTLFDCNSQLVEKYVVELEDREEGGQAFLKVSSLTNIMQVFISTSLFVFMPFQPWYVYSYIYTKENPWYWVIPGAIQEFVCVGQVIAIFLLIGWATVAHANSVGFWVREMHRGHESDQTLDDLREPAAALEIYRSLQVLSTIFNNAMGLGIIGAKIVNWTALIPCGYVLIRSMNGKFVEELPGSLTYPFGVIDCFTCSYGMLQVSANMLDVTASFTTCWSRTRHKTLRQMVISCPVLKVKIGKFYFITVRTILTFYQSIFDYITNCIVTFP